jgi:preprotein translocase subunit SecG
MLLVAGLGWEHYLFMVPLALLSIFLILVILVQRGRGGGLTGALGGMGGQSAFGTKAGDLFTRVTIVVAAIWVLLAMVSLKVLNKQGVTGYDPRIRGSSTAPSEKSGKGGLLPSATKSDDTSTEKASEAGATSTPATSDAEPATGLPPASTPPPTGAEAAPASSNPPASTDAGAKPADTPQP